ncbi:hypothetical protein ET495_08170 [Xylanimonas allomyrinae]|nr:hypothetical protein ET495_08170 [Xylanimonas allomyrinae]QAY68638.1 hypothetical protein ET471_00070 [Xylanimonas protaetiae]QAY69654.1 hypothetical protein ET471_06040 [Xylanimonas protaetiae]
MLRSMRRPPIRLPRLAAALLVLCTLSFGLASPAAASAPEVMPLSSASCAAGRFCLWSGSMYAGTFYGTTGNQNVTGLSSAKSVWNRSGRAVRVFSGAAGTGTSQCFAAGVQSASVSVPAGSVRFLTTTSC